MSRILLNERIALACIQDAERVVDLLLGSNGVEARTPEDIELRRVAVFGQALLLVDGRAHEWRARPGDVAATLRRLVTPSTKEQREAIASRAKQEAAIGRETKRIETKKRIEARVGKGQ